MTDGPDLFSDPDRDNPGPGSGAFEPGQGRALDPLAVRMRPRTIAEVVGQDHLTFPGSPLNQLVEASGGDRAPQRAFRVLRPAAPRPPRRRDTLQHHAHDRA